MSRSLGQPGNLLTQAGSPAAGVEFEGNAIIAMRFDTSEIGVTWTDICAYGTAAKVSKKS
jgi:hypothetical protein